MSTVARTAVTASVDVRVADAAIVTLDADILVVDIVVVVIVVVVVALSKAFLPRRASLGLDRLAHQFPMCRVRRSFGFALGTRRRRLRVEHGAQLGRLGDTEMALQTLETTRTTRATEAEGGNEWSNGEGRGWREVRGKIRGVSG